MDETTVSLPAPWQRLLAAYGKRYRRATGVEASAPLVDIDAGLPRPRAFDDPVLHGFSRKACVAMLQACTVCGRRARRRYVQEQRALLCACCFGRKKLAQEISALLEDFEESGHFNTPGERVAWHEHEMSPRIRLLIPNYVWRQTTVPGAGLVRFVGRIDLERLSVWLSKFAVFLEAEVANDQARFIGKN